MPRICILLQQKVNKLKTWRKQVVKSTLNLKPKLIPIFKVSMVIFWNKYKSQKKKYMVSWVGTKTMKAKISPRYTKINTKHWKNRFKYNFKHRTWKSEEKHKVYKSKVQTKFNFDDMWKYEMKWRRLCWKIIPHNNVEQIESNAMSYLYLYPFGDLAKNNFHENFHVANIWRNFFKIFLNYK
jgi:hypothetical protein